MDDPVKSATGSAPSRATADGRSPRTPEVSVIVPARDGGGQLHTLLTELERQTVERSRFEIIVVDDGSSDNTAEIVEASNAHLVRMRPPGGAYAARNAGADIARGSVLAFTDADCIPAVEWIENGLQAFKGSGVRIAVGHLDVPVGPSSTVTALVDFACYVDAEVAAESNRLLGGNLWIDRQTFRALGGFNSALQSGGDTELGRLAFERGYDIHYLEAAIVSHPPYTNPRGLARKSFRIGRGLAVRSRDGRGKRGWRQPGREPRRYLPSRKHFADGRLHRAGISVSYDRRIRVRAAHYFLVQLPHTVGNLVGLLRVRSSHRRDQAGRGPAT